MTEAVVHLGFKKRPLVSPNVQRTARKHPCFLSLRAEDISTALRGKGRRDVISIVPTFCYPMGGRAYDAFELEHYLVNFLLALASLVFVSAVTMARIDHIITEQDLPTD